MEIGFLICMGCEITHSCGLVERKNLSLQFYAFYKLDLGEMGWNNMDCIGISGGLL
jgi:hypothetical protein